MATPTLVNHSHTPCSGMPGQNGNPQDGGIITQIDAYLPDGSLPGNTLVLAVAQTAG